MAWLIDPAEQVAFVKAAGLRTRDTAEWYRKWCNHKNTAKFRGVHSKLWFDAYLRLASAAGLVKPSQVGTRSTQYCLARKGDTGSYTERRCRFVTVKQNRDECVTNGGYDQSARKLSQRNKYNDEGIAERALRRSRRFTLTSPNGKVYTGRSLHDFCDKHHVPYSSMASVCSGRLASVKGWTGQYL